MNFPILKKCRLQAKSCFLVQSLVGVEELEGLMVVGELVVLKKCDPPLEGSHQEDSGEDLEC